MGYYKNHYQRSSGAYPRTGEYVICYYKGKRFEGRFTGKVVRFRTGYVAGELIFGSHRVWCPWTPKASYTVTVS